MSELQSEEAARKLSAIILCSLLESVLRIEATAALGTVGTVACYL